MPPTEQALLPHKMAPVQPLEIVLPGTSLPRLPIDRTAHRVIKPAPKWAHALPDNRYVKGRVTLNIPVKDAKRIFDLLNTPVARAHTEPAMEKLRAVLARQLDKCTQGELRASHNYAH